MIQNHLNPPPLPPPSAAKESERGEIRPVISFLLAKLRQMNYLLNILNIDEESITLHCILMKCLFMKFELIFIYLHQISSLYQIHPQEY